MVPVIFYTYTFSGGDMLGLTIELQKVVNPNRFPVENVVGFVMNCIEHDCVDRVCIPVVLNIKPDIW